MKVLSVTGLLILVMLSACGTEDEPVNPNAPELGLIGDKSVVVLNNLQIQLSATDPKGEDVTYSVSPASFAGYLSGSTFNWNPDVSDEGTYNLTFVVTNESSLSDRETIKITVAASEGEELYTTNCVRSGCHGKSTVERYLKGCVIYEVNDIVDALPNGMSPISQMSGINLTTNEISAISQYTFDTFEAGCPAP